MLCAHIQFTNHKVHVYALHSHTQNNHNFLMSHTQCVHPLKFSVHRILIEWRERNKIKVNIHAHAANNKNFSIHIFSASNLLLFSLSPIFSVLPSSVFVFLFVQMYVCTFLFFFRCCFHCCCF